MDTAVATDSLGFPLKVRILVGDFEKDGRHVAYENETGEVAPDCEHRIEIRDGLSDAYLAEVVSHEVYHLFYSIRRLITVDEETESQVFGQLVNRACVLAGPREERKTVSSSAHTHQPRPSVGRIVHFVLPWEGREGVHRPAIVVESVDPQWQKVNVNVFLDKYDVRDDIGGFHSTVCVQGVEFDQTGKPGTWHWPERED
jgi:hypothetical protein